MADNAGRLVTVVFTVTDLDRAAGFYSDAFGLDLHVGDHHGDDRWTSGRHAATSWSDGEFMHFALYETKDGTATSGAQIAFRVDDIEAAHARGGGCRRAVSARSEAAVVGNVRALRRHRRQRHRADPTRLMPRPAARYIPRSIL